MKTNKYFAVSTTDSGHFFKRTLRAHSIDEAIRKAESLSYEKTDCQTVDVVDEDGNEIATMIDLST